MCMKNSPLHAESHTDAEFVTHMDMDKHIDTNTQYHFACIYSIAYLYLRLRSAVRARLEWFGRVSQRSRGSQICGVAGTQVFQNSAALTIAP